MATHAARYRIIGASAGGMAAAQAIRELDSTASITVFSEESDPPYFRPMIPFLISGKKQAEQIHLMGEGPYQGANIDVRLNGRVAQIDSDAQTLTLDGGEQVEYDKLLIATGSSPYIPSEIEGVQQVGVYALRTLSDSLAAARRADRTRHAIMLGGGLLNLKTAFALLERNLDVTLVVRSPEVLSQLMEPDDATLIRDALNRAGLKIYTGVSATHIQGNGDGVAAVQLDNGQELAGEMVCIGKGVYPNVAFIDPAQLSINSGVVVDRFTGCSKPNVYAAGDVAVTFDPITGNRIVTGLWTNAVEMGRCAGFNMAGRPTEYTGTFGILNATQVADEPFVSMGIVHTHGTDYETHISATRRAYRKVVFSPEGDRLVGILLIGDIARAGLYRLVIREKMPVKHIKRHIINHTLHYGHMMRR